MDPLSNVLNEYTSDLPAPTVTTGTTPPGQYTGIAFPPVSLKVSIPTERLPVESCITLIVKVEDPVGMFVRTNALIVSDAVNVNVIAEARSRVTSLEEIDAAPTLSDVLLNLAGTLTSKSAVGLVEPIPTEPNPT